MPDTVFSAPSTTSFTPSATPSATSFTASPAPPTIPLSESDEPPVVFSDDVSEVEEEPVLAALPELPEFPHPQKRIMVIAMQSVSIKCFFIF